MTLIAPTAYLLACIAAIAVAEYLAHRLVQHHPCPGVLAATYQCHVGQHHRRGRLDVNIDAPAWWYALLGTPLWAPPVALGRPGLALAVLALVCGYAVLWTGLHRAFHGVGGRWAVRLPGYRALEAHHLTHHARPGRNFGAVFGPLLDRPLGTWAGPAA